MSLNSTFSSASIRGYQSFGLDPPSNYNSVYFITTTANKDYRYTNIFVSKEDIGNGQFIVTKQPFVGNVNIRNVANTFTKTISNLTANSAAGSYNAVINEQGNIIAVGNSDYIKIYEYNGSNYALSSNLLPDANAIFFNGKCLDFSSNANLLIAGCGGNTNTTPFIAVYSRSGSSFTLQNTINAPAGNGQFGSCVSISYDGNTFITAGIVSSNTTAGRVQIYNYANGNYTLNTTISSPGATYFGDYVKLNSAGNVATIKALSRMYIYEKINNVWQQTSNISTNRGIGANQSSLSETAISNNSSTVLIGDSGANSNAGNMLNYYKNNIYKLYDTITWANSYANSYFGYNVAGDNQCEYIAATNFFNGAGSNVHVLALYQKI